MENSVSLNIKGGRKQVNCSDVYLNGWPHLAFFCRFGFLNLAAVWQHSECMTTTLKDFVTSIF